MVADELFIVRKASSEEVGSEKVVLHEWPTKKADLPKEIGAARNIYIFRVARN